MVWKRTEKRLEEKISYREIGECFGISRERVRQILKVFAKKNKRIAQELRTVRCRRIIKKCKFCGKEFSVILSNSNAKYCSKKCFVDCKRVTATKECEVCGKEFTVKSNRRKESGRFCSKRCQGKWLGKNYGFKCLI